LAGLCGVQHSAEPDHGRSGIGIADLLGQKPDGDLIMGESKLGGHAGGKSHVRLVKHRMVEIAGRIAKAFHEVLRCRQRMAIVSGLPGESSRMLRIVLVGTPPKVGRVAHKGIGPFKDGEALSARAEYIGCSAGGRREFQGIAGPSLGCIHSGCEGIVCHA